MSRPAYTGLRWIQVALLFMTAIASMVSCGRQTATVAPLDPRQNEASDIPAIVPVGQSGSEIASVRLLLDRFQQVHSLGEVPAYFTNHTAATVGGIWLYASAKGSQESPNSDDHEADLKKRDALIKEIEEAEKNAPPGETPGPVEKNGRQWLVRAIEVLAPLQGHEDPRESLQKELILPPDQYDFQVISPTLVRCSAKGRQKTSVNARVEAGGWRLALWEPQEQNSPPGAGAPTLGRFTNRRPQ